MHDDNNSICKVSFSIVLYALVRNEYSMGLYTVFTIQQSKTPYRSAVVAKHA